MKRSATVAVIVLLALVLAEAAPPENPGDKANGPKEDKEPNGPKEDKEPNGPKEDKEPNGPKEDKPGASSSSPKKVRCMDKYYPSCYFTQFTCPEACPHSCQADCATCGPVCDCNRAGAVCQDPRFVGADGITFYFHGKKDQDFCLVSDSNLHINGHFIGKRTSSMGCDYTWVQALGLLFDNHQLYLGAQKTTATWDDTIDRLSLSFDGQPIDLSETEGASWKSPAGGVTIRSLELGLPMRWWLRPRVTSRSRQWWCQ